MSDSFQYRVGFDADTSGLDKATQAVGDLTDKLDGLGSTEVTVDTERAQADVLALQDELDNFDQKTFRAEMVVDLAKAQADVEKFAAQLDELQDFDLPGVREGVQAQFEEASERVRGLEQDLRDLDGLTATPSVEVEGGEAVVAELGRISAELSELHARKADLLVELSNGGQVIGDIEQINARINELDGRVAEIRLDTSNADENTQKLTRSASGARNALSNMIGNSVQDLGQLGGIAQSAGVAIGQMAEYSSDAAIAGEGIGNALGKMAAVAGPIAALSVGIGLVSSAINKSKEKAEQAAASMDRFSKGLEDTVGAAKDLDAALDAAFDVGAASEVALVTRAFTDALNPDKVHDYQQALAELSMTGEDFVREFQLAGGTFDQFVKRQAFAAGATDDVIDELATLVENFDGYSTILGSASDATGEFIRQNQELVTGLDDMGNALGGLSLENLARNFLEAQKGTVSETEAVNEAIAATNTYTDALQEYLEWKQRQNAVQSQARSSLDAERTMWESITQAQKDATAATQEAQRAQQEALNDKALQDQVTMLQSIADETDRLTFTQQELNDAFRSSADPLDTMSTSWATLINDFRDGEVDIGRTLRLINEIAAATGREPGDIFTIVKQQADEANQATEEFLSNVGKAIDKINSDQIKGIADAFGQLRDAKLDGAASAIENITTAFENQVGAVADGIGAVRDYRDAVTQASIDIGNAIADTPDIVSALSTEFGKVNDLFSGLSFDVDFKPALDKALDDLNSFKPDLQTTADEWATILKGQPIDIFGNVRADDDEFMAKLGNLRSLFQQGVVNEFEQGGVEAANTFVQSTAATIANSTGLSIQEVYRIMGLPPDGTITTLIAPEVEAQHASQAAAILDALAGTSSDPRIAAMQVQLETGNIDGDIAYVESLLLARELGIPVSLEGIPQADIDAAQAQIDANSFVATITAQADTAQANADLDGVAKGILGSIWPGGVRTATITAEAETDAAASELAAFIAQKRQLVVDAILGTVPSASQIAATIGTVRVPIDYYIRSDPRVNGSRLKAVG